MGLKVTITAEGGTPVILADDADGELARSGFGCNNVNAVDAQGLLRAEFITLFDRKNRLKRITFQTQKIHESPIEAHRYAVDHPDEVPVIGMVELEISDGVSTFSRWFRNAGVASVGVPRVLGCSTWQTYEILAGETLKSNPSIS